MSSCVPGCSFFSPLVDLQGQQIIGVDAGADWGLAWRRVLQVPKFTPHAGMYGPMKIRVEAADELDGIDIYYTVVSDAAAFKSAPYPNYTSDDTFDAVKLPGGGTVEFKNPPVFYSVRAMAACSSCGASYSASVEARYHIVNKV